jgi:hypothetical protein
MVPECMSAAKARGHLIHLPVETAALEARTASALLVTDMANPESVVTSEIVLAEVEGIWSGLGMK